MLLNDAQLCPLPLMYDLGLLYKLCLICANHFNSDELLRVKIDVEEEQAGSRLPDTKQNRWDNNKLPVS